MRSLILDLHRKLFNNEISPKKLVSQSLRKAKKFKYTNFLLAKTDTSAKAFASNFNKTEISRSYLSCIPYVLKDNVSTQGILTTGGSAFLKNYVPPYDATVYSLLNRANAVLIGKANMDEFGLGGTGSFSAYGVVCHPFNKKRIAGGSSSGSAVAVASGVVPFAIGTDTGDSIRRPASFCGVVGYKPTYGLISRYGVFPYAPSLDHVGTFTTTVADAAIVADALISFDEKDFSSTKFDKKLFDSLLAPVREVRIGYPQNIENWMSQNVVTAWNQLKYVLAAQNIKLVPLHLDLELINAIDPVYKIISYSEAVSCYSSYTGIQFGQNVGGNSFNEVAGKVRDALFGEQLKRRFTIGSFALKKENFEKYFLKAKLVRTKINNHFNSLFKDVDIFITVGASSVAPLISDVLADKPVSNIIDDVLQLANFAGAPSITIPFAFSVDNLSIGLNITGQQFNDDLVLRIARQIEEILHNGGSINV